MSWTLLRQTTLLWAAVHGWALSQFHVVVFLTMSIFFWENLALFARLLRDTSPVPGRS